VFSRPLYAKGPNEEESNGTKGRCKVENSLMSPSCMKVALFALIPAENEAFIDHSTVHHLSMVWLESSLGSYNPLGP
jgi:hypothetical protein